MKNIIASLLCLSASLMAQTYTQVPGTNLYFQQGVTATMDSTGDITLAWPHGYDAPIELRQPATGEREIQVEVTAAAVLPLQGTCLAQQTNMSLATMWNAWGMPYTANTYMVPHPALPSLLVCARTSAGSRPYLEPWHQWTQHVAIRFESYTGQPYTPCIQPRSQVGWSIIKIKLH